ncbi:MAG TPA: YbaB/EbfC family nucleoid-associated protein [Deltaproteobacteria bacterium]|nr:YbaB/EbfC family nucleoid-associated protein [Deltaproteobacteria bacterium]HOM28968.1 YbaB/EbfC family nucleoid-associated protein [Deltaproteobacteria bacterium]HPP80393.1 YbaB/EbfC family nucleoid-associated protein [Deltaproteobacteria bacterium]
MEYDLKDLFRQAARIQEKIKEIQEQLSRRTVTVDTGGGMVTVTVNGRQEVVSIKLDPQCVDPRDIPMLEDLILTAVNLGMKRSRELAAEEMKHLTGPYPLPFTVT